MTDTMVRGPQWGGTGTTSPFTAGFSGAQRSVDAHARFVQAALEGRLFSGGMSVTSIANATFTVGTLTASCTPIAGIFNPTTSAVNAIVYQAILQIIITALQNTGGGTYVWASSVGNTAVSTGNAPFNRKTGLATGSAIKDVAGVALTGLSNNLVVRHAAALGGGSLFGGLSTLATAAGFNTALAPSVENFDGSIIVPPGGVLALLATSTPVAHSAASAMMWEELPLYV